MFCSNYKKPIIDSIKNWVTLHFICVIETSVESRKLDIGRVLFLLFHEPRHNRGFIKSAGEKEQKNCFHQKKKRLLFQIIAFGRVERRKKIYPFVYFFTNFPFCNGWHHYYFFNYRCLQIKIRWFYKWNSNIEVRLQFTLVYWSMSPNVWWVALNADRCCF